MNLNDLKVASSFKKSDKKERSTTPINIIAKSATKLSKSSHSQQLSDINAENTPSTANFIRKMTKEEKKIYVDTTQSPEAESKPIVHYGFDDRLSGKLRSGYSVPSTAIVGIRRSWVLNCRQPACFWKMRAEKKYGQVAPFLQALHIRNLHHANVFLSNKLVTVLQHIVLASGTVTAVNEIDFLTDLTDIWAKPLYLNDWQLALSFFLTTVPTCWSKQCYPVREDFADSMEPTSKVWRALKRLEAFDSTVLKNLEEFMLLHSLGKTLWWWNQPGVCGIPSSMQQKTLSTNWIEI